MAPRKSVSASKRQKNSEISKIISDIMHTWEKTGKIGKSRPPTRKDAQKMAIAVAYSIHNRKTTKKAEFFDAESTFKGKIIWDWQAQIEVNPDDWQDISKNLLNSATINTIERECKNYLNEYIGEIITEAVAGEELYVYTQQYGDMIIDLTFEMDYDYLGFSSETFGAENNCMHCGQPLEEVEIWEDFRCPLCSKSISDIYQGMKIPLMQNPLNSIMTKQKSFGLESGQVQSMFRAAMVTTTTLTSTLFLIKVPKKATPPLCPLWISDNLWDGDLMKNESHPFVVKMPKILIW